MSDQVTKRCSYCDQPTEWRDPNGRLVASLGLSIQRKDFCTAMCRRNLEHLSMDLRTALAVSRHLKDRVDCLKPIRRRKR